MLVRHVSSQLLEALSDTSVVLLNGARQTGKSTLVRGLPSGAHQARYLTLDDLTVLAAARSDPEAFIAGLDGPAILDEVQRAPELFLAIKAAVDRNRRPGRFLLTGSADILLLPQLADSLAGRMEILTLWPLSEGEIAGVKENFLDTVFQKKFSFTGSHGVDRRKLVSRLLMGGYPPVLSRPSAERRKAWFASYVTTILQRDVRDLANIEGLTVLPRLLSFLATRAGLLLNFADISRVLAIPQSTLKRYMTLLETMFLVQHVPAWSANLGKRLVKSPKLILNDTGLIAYLIGLTEERLAKDGTLLGPLLENFVVMELRKQAAWSATRPQIFHFRLQTGQEVDIVLEDSAGNIVGIEVKASSTAGAADFKGLRTLAEAAGPRFRRGLVLYMGSQSIRFGPRLDAVPVSTLWARA